MSIWGNNEGAVSEIAFAMGRLHAKNVERCMRSGVVAMELQVALGDIRLRKSFSQFLAATDEFVASYATGYACGRSLVSTETSDDDARLDSVVAWTLRAEVDNAIRQSQSVAYNDNGARC